LKEAHILTVFLTVKRYTAIAAVATMLAAIMLMISLASCAFRGSEDIHTKIYRKYSDIQSFSAEVEVVVTSEKTTNTYQMRQYYQAPDNYREEVLSPANLAGLTYVFSGGSVSVFPPNDGESIRLEDVAENRNYMFLPDFFDKYFNSDNAIVAVSTEIAPDDAAATDDTATILEVLLDGNNIYRASQKLWIDNKTAMPIKLETYNIDGTVLVSVTFTEFNLNDKIDSEIFNLR
jgi:outer membrane lipoprotein-sorting protein